MRIVPTYRRVVTAIMFKITALSRSDTALT